MRLVDAEKWSVHVCAHADVCPEKNLVRRQVVAIKSSDRRLQRLAEGANPAKRKW